MQGDTCIHFSAKSFMSLRLLNISSACTESITGDVFTKGFLELDLQDILQDKLSQV